MATQSPYSQGLKALVFQRENELKTERQMRQEADARAAAQISKLSDNNSHLARANNRLTQQLERSRRECDGLKHLAAGRSAVARAKEAELTAEISSMKHLLKESLAEREAMHAQVLAKQEVARYLEWRLSQAQGILEAQEKPLSPAFRGPLAAAFSAAAKAAAGEDPDDSFGVLSDTAGSTVGSNAILSAAILPGTVQPLGRHGLVSVPAAAAWARGTAGDEAEKENINIHAPWDAPETTPRIRRPATPLAPRFDLAGAAEPRPTERSLTAGTEAITGNADGQSLAVVESVDHVAPSSPSEIASSIDASNSVSMVEGNASSGVQLQSSDQGTTSDQTPMRQPLTEEELKLECVHGNEALLHTPTDQDFHSPAGVTKQTPGSMVRSSVRNRRPVSYALPSVRRKLRQGDPHTFGDAQAFRKKTPRSRTKPRARHSLTSSAPRRGATLLENLVESDGSDSDTGN